MFYRRIPVVLSSFVVGALLLGGGAWADPIVLTLEGTIREYSTSWIEWDSYYYPIQAYGAEYDITLDVYAETDGPVDLSQGLESLVFSGTVEQWIAYLPDGSSAVYTIDGLESAYTSVTSDIYWTSLWGYGGVSVRAERSDILPNGDQDPEARAGLILNAYYDFALDAVVMEGGMYTDFYWPGDTHLFDLPDYVGNAGYEFYGILTDIQELPLGWNSSVVPEPASFALIGLGLAGLALRGLRKKRD